MGGNRNTILIIGACALLAVLVFFAGGNNSATIARSQIGTEGLYRWMTAQGTSIAKSHRRLSMNEEDVSLRILPLYDMDLTNDLNPPSNTLEARAQTTLIDLEYWIVYEKIERVPTLVALPKWRGGVLSLGVLDEQLLIPQGMYRRLLGQLETPLLRIIRPDTKLMTADGITLYRPQLFDKRTVNGGCKPVISVPEGVLIAHCDSFDRFGILVLSDPDLINNHGLTLGENADVAATLNDLAPRSGTVLLDTSDRLLLTSADGEPQEQRPRSLEDMSRFWSYPFTLIWIAALSLLLIAFWRGLIRFGPPAKTDDGRIGASNEAAIEAKAYLLRLTGQDHALVADYAKNKLGDLARDVLGKDASRNQDLLFKRLHTLAPAKAEKLLSALNALEQSTEDTPATTLASKVQEFDDTYRSIQNELGHVSKRR
jgi:hypothetical protein